MRALRAIAPLVLCAAFAVTWHVSAAAAEEATWRSEQPLPVGSQWPIGLGAVGDLEFIAANRGLLITAGNPPTVPAGVWAYNGVEWHELSSVCGASDGRIASAGPEEFWTVSDGRPGQTSESSEFIEPPPLQDNTLCHFAGGRVVGSYAHPAFRADSYQAMHAAACYGPSDCWFGGDPLPTPQIGAFQLHWAGALDAEPYPSESHAIEDMLVFEGVLYESARVSHGDAVAGEVPEPAVLRRINPSGVQPTFQEEPAIPLYGPNELPEALESLSLSGADGSLWGAAGGKRAAGEAGQVTVVRRAEGSWTQLFGATSQPLPAVLPRERAGEEVQLLGGAASTAAVSAIAAEPGTDSTWLALRPREASGTQTRAVLARVSSQGQVLEEQTLPSDREVEEGVGPKGSVAKIVCPQLEDCWAATTQGWLFHLAPNAQRQLTLDQDPNFVGPITVRPTDQGLPQIPPDAPPPDTSGLVEASPFYGGVFKEPPTAEAESRVSVPLLSHLRSRVIDGSVLQLSFHLAVKARVRLLARRKRKVVAKTPTRTLSAGNRKLLLHLDRRRWPTKLELPAHALAPLPTVSTRGAAVGTVSTGFVELTRTLLLSEPGSHR